MPKEETKEEIKKPVLVVKDLPKQPVRFGLDAEGKEYEFITIDEALTEILAAVREIKKSVA